MHRLTVHDESKMPERLNLLDLRTDSHSSAMSSSSRPLRSPRMHMVGEAPPELSPLDAFALQSRLLAKQLQESNRDGNRMSRLPPLTMQSPLIVQGRSEYFRSMPADSASDPESPELPAGFALKTEIEDAFSSDKRPRSMHPRMSRIRPPSNVDVPALLGPLPDTPRGRQMGPVRGREDIFGARHERSPSPIQSDSQSQCENHSEPSPACKNNSLQSTSPRPAPVSAASTERTKQDSFDELGLVPPPSLFTRRSSSILSSPVLEDGENSSNMGSSLQSSPRKMSSGSAALASSAHSPAMSLSFKRSPSAASDSSALPRPSFNFSRPLSRADAPGFDVPTRQASSDSQPSFILADDTAHTPVSMHSEAFMDQQTDEGKGAPSYIYSKFSLPRGKALQREEPNAIHWEQPLLPLSNIQFNYNGAPPSPPTRPSSSSARTVPDDAISTVSSMTRPSVDVGRVSMENSRLGVTGLLTYPPRPSVDATRKSDDGPRGRALTSALHEQLRGRTPASTNTSDSASTVRPPPSARSLAPTASDISAEEHLAKGIECHEKGSLKESTYHLRLAARQNLPTAMLLYALACRHGWGMRANQREGVEWLRKAAEHASIEIADDEDQLKEGRAAPASVVERKARKAQFALSIYELGVSHMNGWGIEQDKSLALRCFEIAGNWGDVDALAEAGFCYAQGIGCKKNLKKSAKFYRMAEAKGMSMVGNSWIHKAKYNDDDQPSPSKDRRKTRSKSRTRTMFGLKS
ncbi:Tetratricopeptide-like helical [Metarhizium album ARSEF 1941]|uniref:Tetratricopeptide-like helical n=1 Tax=Metarhizium album (strain ARSEF 1941) TaxID=1081103 RepID=A0A0B2WS68_METAS|nr:Tetratricopeptide-like helical [Metarhizium album ARSEF 1941]KHN96484.1 Tetratricopeptide-like helical [Metarhizium album ARSEF 1941]